MIAVLSATLLGLACQEARAEVKLHPLFTDGLVLQQGIQCPVWGTADPDEKVHVVLNTGSQTMAAEPAAAGSDGKWRTAFQALKAGGPFTLTVKGKNTITLKDVYVGEVWVASGQSNMEMALQSCFEAKKDIEHSENPKIRLFTVPKNPQDKPVDTVNAHWVECGPNTAGHFSAVAYYFGRDLQKALNVPVGLIHSSWGGTVAEAWATRESLESNPTLKPMVDAYEKRYPEDIANYKKTLERYKDDLDKYKQAAAKAKEEGKKAPMPPKAPNDPTRNPNRPCVLYDGMIHPLQPYAIRGAIWYQGESNAGRAEEYKTLFPVMIQSWRDSWKQGDFPFLFVQLAPYHAISKEPTDTDWARLREAQLQTLKLPRTGMAVITDVGDEKDIHPRKKEPVGARLALAARDIAYGEKITCSGPEYESLKVADGKAILGFKHIGRGLEARDGELTGFTIAGPDKQFHNAKARIQGDKVIVWSEEVKEPVAVRFGWANYPVVNLWNKDGLPASPFRTDDWPKR